MFVVCICCLSEYFLHSPSVSIHSILRTYRFHNLPTNNAVLIVNRIFFNEVLFFALSDCTNQSNTPSSSLSISFHFHVSCFIISSPFLLQANNLTIETYVESIFSQINLKSPETFSRKHLLTENKVSHSFH